jgi:NADPH:quinone reductase-like Zn-dependent oxidoreductase
VFRRVSWSLNFHVTELIFDNRYCVAKGDIQFKIPDNTTDEEAATLGVGVNTVGQGLYQSLELPLPGSGKADIWLLIYGGSTATGSLAIQ